jgi:hypothetical protein
VRQLLRDWNFYEERWFTSTCHSFRILSSWALTFLSLLFHLVALIDSIALPIILCHISALEHSLFLKTLLFLSFQVFQIINLGRIVQIRYSILLPKRSKAHPSKVQMMLFLPAQSPHQGGLLVPQSTRKFTLTDNVFLSFHCFTT